MGNCVSTEDRYDEQWERATKMWNEAHNDYDLNERTIVAPPAMFSSFYVMS